MHTLASPSFSLLLPPLAHGFAWGLTAQGWAPVPYAGPVLSPPLAGPAAPLPGAALLDWLAAAVATDPHLAQTTMELALAWRHHDAARAQLAEALDRFEPLPEADHERAAWLRAVAAQDEPARAAMLTHAHAHQATEAARAAFCAALAPHHATAPTRTAPATTSVSPTEIAPMSSAAAPPSTSPTPTTHTASAPAAEDLDTHGRSSPASSTPPRAVVLEHGPDALAQAHALAAHDPRVAFALGDFLAAQQRAAAAGEAFGEALARHGPAPGEHAAHVAWLHDLTARDPQLAGIAAADHFDHVAAQLAEALAPHAARAPPSHAPPAA